MIVNGSRIHGFQECRRKDYNWDFLGLSPPRTDLALLTGSAFHKGAAHILAFRNLDAAKTAAEAEFRADLPEDLLPEETEEYEAQLRVVEVALEKFYKNFLGEPYTVIHPEVQFCVPLPGTEHHCWFAHKLLHPDIAYDDCIHPDDVTPHYFAGRTDAIIQLRGLVWLLEHKTTSWAYSLFVRQFQMAEQPTGYIYGVWKATGLRPHGFILNVIQKPNKRQAKSDPFKVEVEREPFFRSDADLERFERQLIEKCNDRERAYIDGTHYMNTGSCHNWNRACYYLPMCLNHRDPEPGEFVQRIPDYVSLEYYKVLGLPVPPELAAAAEGKVPLVRGTRISDEPEF